MADAEAAQRAGEEGSMRALRFLARLLLAVVGLTLGVSIVSVGVAAAMKPRLPDRSRPEDDELDMTAIFDSRRLRSSSGAFRGGRLICWQGSADLDLRGAQLDPAGGDLLVWTVFGGTRILVPQDWPVDARGVAVLGGARSAAAAPEPGRAGPVLSIRHRTVFGGLAVVAGPDDQLLAV